MAKRKCAVCSAVLVERKDDPGVFDCHECGSIFYADQETAKERMRRALGKSEDEDDHADQ